VHLSSDTSFGGVLDIHIIVIVAVSVRLQVPASSVLELLGDLPPVPIVSHPAGRRSTISSINFERVKSWHESKSAKSHCLPESSPLDNFVVFVNSFTMFEIQGGVWIHTGCLDEGLELVAGMGRCALNANYTLNRLLSQDWIAKTVCYMWEFLIITPINFVFATTIVVVVGSRGPVLQLLLEIDFLSLTKPLASRFSVPMVELEETIVKVLIRFMESRVFLVEPCRHVAFFVQVFRSNLGDVHVYEESVVTINLKKLVLSKVLGVKVIADVDMLMG